MMMNESRASWSGQVAFILAAAASAIGLGNLWRFPYLAAQYGGGTFLLIYLFLTVTLGFTLLVTEIAIGRKTQQSQQTAYTRLHRGWGFIGTLSTLVPMLILPYYCVIGGWVLKYLCAYGEMAFCKTALMGTEASQSGDFFSSFIASPLAPFIYGLIFALMCASVIMLGVKKGIEKANLVMMPILLVMAVALAIYVVCLPSARAGLSYYLLPNSDCLRTATGQFSLALLAKTVMGAMGQMFFSLSIAMGIMVTYGSYMKRSDSIEKSVRRIEIFDTLIALFAGLMIIPIVYLFAVKTGVTPELIAAHGGDLVAAEKAAVKTAMGAGPGLMFITLPKVFAMLGPACAWIGFSFFLLVTFAAATSCISIFEACVAAVCDQVKMKRFPATVLVTVACILLSVLSALGYGTLDHVRVFSLPFLDFFDFITNSIFMPLVALLTCVFIGWIAKPQTILEECTREGQSFHARTLYCVMVKFVAPVLVIAVFISELCRALKIGGWSI